MITFVNCVNTLKYNDYHSSIKKRIKTNNNCENSKNLYELDKYAQMNKMFISFKGIEKINNIYPKHTADNYSGCMLGAAIGDAFGKTVEYDSIDNIRETYGLKGITELMTPKGIAEISEDTQLSMFTADGIIKSAIRQNNDDNMPDIRYVHDSYKDWMITQQENYAPTQKGWISNIEDLYQKRGYRLQCEKALKSGKMGSIERPINNIKGSDGVMRTAPAGLKYYKNPQIAFEAGARCAAITNGSPAAYLSAGLYSAVIANIIQGKDMKTAVDDSLKILKSYKDHEEILELVEKAKKLAGSHLLERIAINKIGAGWNADEAVAIGIYAALKHPDDFKKAVLTSANHSGDSDTTAGITGGLVGAYIGEKQIPDDWKYKVEFCFELDEISRDLFTKASEIENSDKKYPLPVIKKKTSFFD